MPGHSTTVRRWCFLCVIGRVALAIGGFDAHTEVDALCQGWRPG